MIKLIKLSDCKETPWKNGRGVTRQIDIHPENATVTNNDFLWRLSSAEVSGPDPFSLFPESDRLLIVWKGGGLLLNGKELLPDSPIQFSGEEKIYCDLINGPVIDLGLIYKRDRIKARMKVLTLAPENSEIRLESSLCFLFKAQFGICTINQMEIEGGDILKIQNETELKIVLNAPSLFFQISVDELT